MMEEVSKRCVQLKGLPAVGVENSAVKDYLDQSLFRSRYQLIDRYEEKEDDIRWLILFKSQSDAEECIKGNPWSLSIGGQRFQVQPDYCSECIVPYEWTEYAVENNDKEPSGTGNSSSDESFSVIPEERNDLDLDDEHFNSGDNVDAKRLVAARENDLGDNGDKEAKLEPYKDMADSKPQLENIQEESSPALALCSNLFGMSLQSMGNLSVRSEELFGSGEVNVNDDATGFEKNIDIEHDGKKTGQEELPIQVRKGVDQASNKVSEIIDEPSNQVGTKPKQLSHDAGEPRDQTGELENQAVNKEEKPGNPAGAESEPEKPSQLDLRASDQANALQGQMYGSFPAYGQPYGYPGHPSQQQYGVGMNNPAYGCFQNMFGFMPPQFQGQGQMPGQGIMPGQGQMPSQGLFPLGQGQMSGQGQMPDQGQMSGQWQMPGQGQIQGQGQFPGQLPILGPFGPHLNPYMFMQAMAMMQQNFVPCTYDSLGNLKPILQSPTTPEKTIASEPQTPESGNSYVSMKAVSKTQEIGTKKKEEATYVYMSRHRSRDDAKKQSSVSDSHYMKLDETTIPTIYAPELPPRGIKSPVPKGRTQAVRDDSEPAPEKAELKTASNLKIFDESGNSHESKPDSDYEVGSDNDEQQEDAAEVGCRKIKVTNLRDTATKEILMMLFENRSRTGGGEVVSVDLNPRKREAIIEFKESSVAERVLEKQLSSGIFLSSEELQVFLYDPQIDKRKVFVTGLAKGTSQESLELFFEARCGMYPSTVVYGETPGTALLCFNEEKKFSLLQQEVRSRALENQTLEVFEVEVSRSVKVTGCGDRISKDALCFYFENKRRSSGGQVENVIYQERTGAYVVTFHEVEDAENVCMRGDHQLNDTDIKASMYYPCLDLDSSLVFTIPPPIELKDMNKHLKKFLLQNKLHQNLLCQALSERYGKVHWPTTQEESIKISCTVDKNDTEGSAKVEHWTETCKEEVDSFLDKIKVDDQVQVAKEAWGVFRERLGEINVADPEKVAIYLNQNAQSIVVVGEENAVSSIVRQASTFATELEQQLDAEHHTITKTKRVKKFQIILLVAAKFLDKFKQCSVAVEMSHENGEVSFKGPRKEVEAAINKMTQTIQSFISKPIPGFRKSAIDLLFTTETRNYIKKKYSDKNITGIWDVTRSQTLELYSHNKADLVEAEKILVSCIKQHTIRLDSHMQSITLTQEWSDTLARLNQEKENLFRVDVKPGEIFIAAVDYCFQYIEAEVNNLLDLHSLVSDFVDVDPGKFRFIVSHKDKDIAGIAVQFSQLQVEIKPVDRHIGKGFKVTGKKDGCKLAVHQIKKLVDSVRHRDHTVHHPNISNFLLSGEGRKALSDIEKKSECQLEVAASVANSNAPEGPKVMVKCRLGPRTIAVTQGDMTNVSVDAIVNQTDLMMTNSRGLGAAIIDKGGYEIQKECDDTRGSKGNLLDGDVVVTKGGKLPCKGVLHLVTPKYLTGMKNEEKLKKAVSSCLKAADRKRFKTLMIPILGFGQNKFPLKLAIQWILEALAEDLRTAGKFEALDKVYICDIREEIVKEAVDLVKTILGKIAEVKEVKDETNRKSGKESRGFAEEGAVGGKLPPVSARRPGSIHTSVVVGELVKQQVDVIVNSTSTDLNLSQGSVSRAVLKAGGSGIQQECRKNYPTGIKQGELAVTSGGRMACHYVFHCVLVSWDHGAGGSEKFMKFVVNACLEMADSLKMTSIAFPALGTGVLEYPADVVAQLMLDTVAVYQTKNVGTKLKEVQFVIWPGDTTAVQVFKKVVGMDGERYQHAQMADLPENPADTFSSNRLRTTSNIAGGYSENKVSSVDTHNKFIKSFGELTVEIVKGDITQEKSEVIVNSILRDLNLNSGNVSRAILLAAGQRIQTECSSEQSFQDMQRDGLVVTSGGNMPYCRKIFHVESKDSETEWTRVVLSCLTKADQQGFTSISFPALGTGGKGCSPEGMTRAMFAAFKQFSEGSTYKGCLKQARIVIFQAEMVAKFVNAAQDRPKSRSSKIRFMSKKKQKEESATFYIYGESRARINKAAEMLDSMYEEEEMSVSRNVVKALESSSKKKELQSVVSKHGVEVHIDNNRVSIMLLGYKSTLEAAKTDVKSYLATLEDRQQEEYGANVKYPSSWRGSLETTRFVQLKNSDVEYANVASRLQSEMAMPTFQVCQIDKIQNPFNYKEYIMKKQQMESSQVTVPKELLWFGCKGSYVSSIINHGFSTTFAITSEIGTGLHFAKSALAAMNSSCIPDAYGYIHIFLVEVLIGKCGLGYLNANSLRSDKDAFTDSIVNPRWFVISASAQALPLYHVIFKV